MHLIMNTNEVFILIMIKFKKNTAIENILRCPYKTKDSIIEAK